MEEEKTSREWNKFLELSVIGSELYNIRRNNKHFTKQIIHQVKDQFMYVEYSVAEDLTINKKMLLKLPDNDSAFEAAESYLANLLDIGFKVCTSEPPVLISLGTISSLMNKPQIFHDCSKLSPAEVEKITSCILEQKECEDLVESKEERNLDKQIIGDNIDYDYLSHSHATLHAASISDLPFTTNLGSRQERLAEYERYKIEKQTNSHHKNIQPIGPASEGMISIMLLNQYKNMDVSSKR